MKETFKIGDIIFQSRAFLSPMAGYTDLAYRKIAEEFGAGMTTTEMVSARALARRDKKTASMLKTIKANIPTAVQIFGSEVESMIESTKILNDIEDFQIIDINMGCPAPKIVKNGDGSALMKNPTLAYEIASGVVNASKKPVTCKIRMGWDEKSINAVEFSKALEEAGVSAICIHARTREMYYTGEADWDMIGEVNNCLTIPVIGNGDIFEARDAFKMMDQTGVKAVQIGRGAVGNPWIFKNILRIKEGKDEIIPTNRAVYDIIVKHYNLLIEDKGERIAINEMRKHIGQYLKGIHSSSNIRREINTTNDKAEVFKILEDFLLKGR
ncbi:MAG: tRNA dihydrouridine synthase DusB [Tissierellia bacterium]|nr:tRNA dihydrouridine synthase DusB [Tissierellia bacterium]